MKRLSIGAIAVAFALLLGGCTVEEPMDNSVERGYEIAPGVAENDDEARAIAEMDAYLREKYPNIEYEVVRYSPGDGWASPSSTMNAVTPEGVYFWVTKDSSNVMFDSYVGVLLKDDYTAIMCEAVEAAWPDCEYALNCDINGIFSEHLGEDVTLEDAEATLSTNTALVELYIEAPVVDSAKSISRFTDAWRESAGWPAYISLYFLEAGALSSIPGAVKALPEVLSIPEGSVVKKESVKVER